jgi:hypothetical protein
MQCKQSSPQVFGEAQPALVVLQDGMAGVRARAVAPETHI